MNLLTSSKKLFSVVIGIVVIISIFLPFGIQFKKKLIFSFLLADAQKIEFHCFRWYYTGNFILCHHLLEYRTNYE